MVGCSTQSLTQSHTTAEQQVIYFSMAMAMHTHLVAGCHLLLTVSGRDGDMSYMLILLEPVETFGPATTFNGTNENEEVERKAQGGSATP